MMQPMPWNMSAIKQCEKEINQELLKDEQQLFPYSYDFGRINQVYPAAVCIPQSQQTIQAILAYANQHHLRLTIRGNGMSQGGQSLATQDGVILNLKQFNQVHALEKDSIWIDSNASWSQLLSYSLKAAQLPYVLPYNCNLSIGGVLSAGGVGAASFKYGTVSSHVLALEVIQPNGEIAIVDKQSDLFHACLSGQGRFAVINKACLKLRSCLPEVRTFFLVYLDKQQWLHDLTAIKPWADYIEAFCSPALQGARLTTDGRRLPFAQWLYALHVSVEYKQTAPDAEVLCQTLSPWRIMHIQDEPIDSYIHRHNPRFEMMQLSGQWELAHPWYECYVPMEVFIKELDNLLTELPVYYANLLHVVPINLQQPLGFLMLPKASQICEVMILNPGISKALLPACLQTIHTLDRRFLKQGGKRYLSGYIGENLPASYWQTHFGTSYANWLALKNKYDPQHVLGSWLHPG